MSHNQFNDYNVSAQGLILNSGSAQTILNEVIGGSPSQLRGYTEVAGPPNRFRVAVNIA